MHRSAHCLKRTRPDGHALRASERQTHTQPALQGQTYRLRCRQRVHLPYTPPPAGPGKLEALFRVCIGRRWKTSP
eukprot:4127966-Pleurochrysis_carterae.AAC.1